MPRRIRPPTGSGKDQAGPGDAAPGGSRGERRATAALGGRVLERIRETIGSVGRQMGARRRNLARLDRDR
jgi:hypothetical protein